MMDYLLTSRLDRVIRRERRAALLFRLGTCWAVAAFISFVIARYGLVAGRPAAYAPFIIGVLASVSALTVIVRDFSRKTDYRAIALRIEARHPELRGLLLTAVQQLETNARPSFLQTQLINQAIEAAVQADWRDSVPRSRLVLAHAVNFGALCALFLALLAVRAGESHPGRASLFQREREGITVTPGDTELERGNSLVVLARFGGRLPDAVKLVLNESGQSERTVSLVKALADPVFGGSVTDLASDLTYRVEYAGTRTRDFKVHLFEHPQLLRADVALTFPAYTAQPPKRIEDTRRVSAVEGTHLDLALALNKPVAKATLVPKSDPKQSIPLTVTPGKATASLVAFTLSKNESYDLQLVDADGRANKTPVRFVFEALPNRTPEIKIASPRGDVKPSALEEISFEGTIFDDFGSPAYGIAYTLAGGETKNIELGRATAAREKRSFNYMLRLEDLGVKPDDLLSWSVWADDIGPDGQVRRTSSDLFFAEVRPFDEIFRQAQQQQQQAQDDQQQQGQGQQSQQILDLEKQIINATWKLQHDTKPGAALNKQYVDDAGVVHESQKQAIEQANTAAEKVDDTRTKALWSAVVQDMEKAADQLSAAAKSTAPLTAALGAEQSALQNLLKLQAREHSVARGNRNQRGGQGQQAGQRQLDQLDLAREENRYETQRQARSQQTPQRKEQLQVLNRLQELSRRQQDLNERLRDLQTALQEAKTEQEREEARRQLKRLQDEQQQMLADVDELKQRMDRPENQSQLADQRQQLDQTRQDIQRAADAAAQGSASQALAAGTRAQRQLQDMRDQLRKDSSSQFADDLREMRAEARDIARQQEDLTKQLQSSDDAKHRSLSSTNDQSKDVLDRLAQQKDRVDKLEERVQQVSQQAETAEPLLAQQLEDTLRKVAQDDSTNVREARDALANEGLLSMGMGERLQQLRDREDGGKTIDLTREMLQEGLRPQAGQAAERAQHGAEDLRRGVERAADSVIGDDSESLKLAQQQLDTATKQLSDEMNRTQQPGGSEANPANRPGQPNRQGQASAGQPQEDSQSQQPGPGAPNQSASSQRNDPNRLAQSGNNRSPNSPNPSNQPQSPSDAPGANGTTGTNGTSNQPNSSDQLADANQPNQPNQPGQPGGTPRDGNRGQANLNRNAARSGADAGGLTRTGSDDGGGGGLGIDDLLAGGPISPRGPMGPITGDDYAAWSDRLREIEQMVDDPQWRNAVATARERARLVRQDYTRSIKKPDWAVVQLQVLKPLVEVRSHIADELARREASRESLVPIDKDPVPPRFADSVRRYYEELGKDK